MHRFLSTNKSFAERPPRDYTTTVSPLTRIFEASPGFRARNRSYHARTLRDRATLLLPKIHNLLPERRLQGSPLVPAIPSMSCQRVWQEKSQGIEMSRIHRLPRVSIFAALATTCR